MIEFTLIPEGNYIIFTVDRQDAKHTKRRGGADKVFQASNGISIVSSAAPAIKKNTVYIRGTHKHANDNVILYRCENEEHAQNFANLIQDAFREYFESYEILDPEDHPDDGFIEDELLD